VSLVKRFLPAARVILFVSIGAQRIECGLMRQLGSHSEWVEGSVLSIAIGAIDTLDDAEIVEVVEAPIQVVTNALIRLENLHGLRVVGIESLSPIDEVRVIVADSWLAMASVPWSSNLKRDATALAYARSHLASAGFDIEAGDRIKLDDAPLGVPRLTVAYPSRLMMALHEWCRHLNARLTSVLPFSIAAWAMVSSQKNEADVANVPAEALALVDAGVTILGRVVKGRHPRLSEIIVRTDVGNGVKSGGNSDQHLQEVWQRLCLRDPLWATLSHVALLDLSCFDNSKVTTEKPFERVSVSSQELKAGTQVTVMTSLTPHLLLAASVCTLHHSLNGALSSPRLSIKRYFVLALMTLFLITILFQVGTGYLSLKALTSRLNSAMNSTQSVSSFPTWSREELARVQEVNGAIRELNLPISPILSALEPPRDIRVAVLSMETTASSPTNLTSSIKIVAEARTSADMARYVAFVSERKPFIGAYLMSHEVNEAMSERPYRFKMEALWVE